MSNISLYYKNVTADVIGEKHGITPQQFDELADQVKPIIDQYNEMREANRAKLKNGQLDSMVNPTWTMYRELPYNEDYPAQVKAVAESLKGDCENFVVLGIGGSALGNIAVQTALNPYMYNMDENQRNGCPRLFVFDNVDPVQIASFIDWVGDKLEKTIFNVISKSGRTAETAAVYLVMKKLLEEKLGEKGASRIIATTDANEGTLRQIADESGYRTLVVPDGVGGRWSVLSPVGLLSAAVCGIDIDSLLEGARQMDERCSSTDFWKNPAAINAAVNWNYYNAGKPISVMMPYSYALKDLSDWYRQLWAESLGKTKDLNGNNVFVGPTPVKALGTTDQHSQVQLYREGPNDKLFTFLQVKEFSRDVVIGPEPACAPELGYLAGANMSKLLNAEKVATEYALLKDKRPCLTVMFDKVDAESIGQFIYMFEVTTSLTGLLFDIDAYDQPAVELGKEATFALMDRPGFEEMAEKITPVAKLDDKYIV